MGLLIIVIGWDFDTLNHASRSADPLKSLSLNLQITFENISDFPKAVGQNIKLPFVTTFVSKFA
jgi:hypothetical protein